MNEHKHIRISNCISFRSDDEDEEPCVSGGQSQLTPLSSTTSSESEAEQTTARGGHHGCGHSRGRGRGCSRGRSHATAASSVSPATPYPNGWQTDEQADTLPEPLPLFCPARAPGVQGFGVTDNPSQSDLFKTFFDETTVKIICDNTKKTNKKEH